MRKMVTNRSRVTNNLSRVHFNIIIGANNYSLDRLIKSSGLMSEEYANSYKDALRYINCETINDFIMTIDQYIKKVTKNEHKRPHKRP